MEAWVKITNPVLQKYQSIFSRYPRTAPIQGNSRAEFNFQVQTNGNLNFFMGGGSTQKYALGMLQDCGFNKLPGNTWTHVALSIDTPLNSVNPREVRIYINGQLDCQWPQPGAAPLFQGTRQVMHDQPLAFSNFDNGDVEGVPQTFSGMMDEIRIWAGVRTEHEIAENYKRLLPANSTNLIAQYSLNGNSDELLSGIAQDRSGNGHNAVLTGLQGTKPSWVPSNAPIRNIVPVNNFQLTPLELFMYSANPSDTFIVEIDISSLSAYEKIFLDKNANIPLPPSSQVGVLPGRQWPMIWFKSEAPESKTLELRYRAVSRDEHGEIVYSETDQGSVSWGVVEIQVTAIGCDGAGGKLDLCNVCNGLNECPPYGCDGQGGRKDECGVCRGNGDTCPCVISRWRGRGERQLDPMLFNFELDNLSEYARETNLLLDRVTDLLTSAYAASLPCARISDALSRVKGFQHDLSIFNNQFLGPFANVLAPPS